MAFLSFENVGVTALSACVPKNIEKIQDLTYMLPARDVEKLENMVGIRQRRLADEKTCSSDMCFAAAEKLFEDNNVDRKSIDMLLFLSQTGDFAIPITSAILQNRLGLPKTTACMDVNLGCSGFIYGLSTAFSYVCNPNINKVLLLVGECNSKVHCRQDKSAWPLFGDAGSACLIEKGSFDKSYFYLGTDGSGSETIRMKASIAGRFPVNPTSFEEKLQDDGYVRSDVHVKLDGMDVFAFTLNIIQKSIRNVLEFAKKTDSDVDYYLLHQANKFIIDNAVRKLKINPQKVPINIDRYGNVSSPSIPLLVVTEFNDKSELGNVALCGFGVGLSWGSSYLNLSKCKISDLIEI